MAPLGIHEISPLKNSLLYSILVVDKGPSHFVLLTSVGTYRCLIWCVMFICSDIFVRPITSCYTHWKILKHTPLLYASHSRG